MSDDDALSSKKPKCGGNRFEGTAVNDADGPASTPESVINKAKDKAVKLAEAIAKQKADLPCPKGGGCPNKSEPDIFIGDASLVESEKRQEYKTLKIQLFGFPITFRYTRWYWYAKAKVPWQVTFFCDE
jgi:hypothetical protein